MRSISEYPAFDTRTQHYVIATAGGDGWIVTGDLQAAIRNDIDANECNGTDWREWVDSLALIDTATDERIAVFDVRAWRWEDTP